MVKFNSLEYVVKISPDAVIWHLGYLFDFLSNEIQQEIKQNKELNDKEHSEFKESIDSLSDVLYGDDITKEIDCTESISSVANDIGILRVGRLNKGIIADGNNKLYCYYLNNGGCFKAENLSSDNWNQTQCWAAFSGINGTKEEYIKEYSDPDNTIKRTKVSTDGYIIFPAEVKMVIFARYSKAADPLIIQKVTTRENGIPDQINTIKKQIAPKEEDNSSRIHIRYTLPKEDLSLVTISGPTSTSSISNATLYPALVNNKENGDISDLFRYSCPMKVANDVFPNFKSVSMNDKRHGGYCVEFYVDSDFEFIVYNIVRAVIIIDNTIVSEAIDKSPLYSNSHTKVAFNNPDGNKHLVRLYLYGTTFFFGIKTAGTVYKYEKERMLMIADGDSIVEGSATIGVYGTYGCMMSIVSQILGMDFMNVGVGGSGYVKSGNMNQPNMPNRFNTYILPFNPDLLVVMAGLNDSSSANNMDEVKAGIDSYFEKLNNCNAKYTIIVSPYSPTTVPNAGVIAIANYLKEVSIKNNYPYIDTVNGKTYDAFGNIVTGYPDGCLMTTQHRSEWYAEYIAGTGGDTTHPNKVGHEWMGKYLANEIFKLISGY